MERRRLKAACIATPGRVGSHSAAVSGFVTLCRRFRLRDRKYVKIAGHTAYTGILLALNEILILENKKTRKSVEWYQQELSRLDKKINSRFATAYQILHLDMGYDGTRSAKLAQLGMEEAEKIIVCVENRLSQSRT
mgnify:CR=1 FL=1